MHTYSMCIVQYHSGTDQQGLQGSELEQKIRKLLKQATKEVTTRKASHGRESATPAAVPAQPSFLLELASFALENSLLEVAQECVSGVRQELVQDDPVALLQREILRTQLLVAGPSKASGGMYSRSAVEARVQGLGHLEDILAAAVRLPNSDLIEVRCCGCCMTGI